MGTDSEREVTIRYPDQLSLCLRSRHPIRRMARLETAAFGQIPLLATEARKNRPYGHEFRRVGSEKGKVVMPGRFKARSGRGGAKFA